MVTRVAFGRCGDGFASGAAFWTARNGARPRCGSQSLQAAQGEVAWEIVKILDRVHHKDVGNEVGVFMAVFSRLLVGGIGKVGHGRACSGDTGEGWGEGFVPGLSWDCGVWVAVALPVTR